MHDDLLFRIIRQCKTVFLTKVAVSKVSITYAELFSCLNLACCHEADEALVLYFIMITYDDAVRLEAVVDIIQKRHHHKNRIRV